MLGSCAGISIARVVSIGSSHDVKDLIASAGTEYSACSNQRFLCQNEVRQLDTVVLYIVLRVGDGQITEAGSGVKPTRG